MTFMRKILEALRMDTEKHNIDRNTNQTYDISRYDSLPIIDTSQDKYAHGGYVARKMISWEHDFEQCNNIFKNSNLPILCNMDTITRNINTSILQNPNGSIGRTVQEIFYYEIPLKFQNSFLEIVDTLNDVFTSHNLQKYHINHSDVIFTRTRNEFCKYSLPLSLIIYNSEKQTFHYKFSNEIAYKTEYSTHYKNTKYGEIIYDECGKLKKATVTIMIYDTPAKCKFKNYKSGFDLYEIRHNGKIVYKRESK